MSVRIIKNITDSKLSFASLGLNVEASGFTDLLDQGFTISSIAVNDEILEAYVLGKIAIFFEKDNNGNPSGPEYSTAYPSLLGKGSRILVGVEQTLPLNSSNKLSVAISPENHAETHTPGGVDALNVDGMPGVLADPQHVISSEVLEIIGPKDNANPRNHDRFSQDEIAGLPEDQLDLVHPTHSNAHDPTQSQKEALDAASNPNSENPFVTRDSLPEVGRTGSYTDLSNKPTLPTKLSDLVDDIPEKNRLINDAVVASDSLYSSTKIESRLSTKVNKAGPSSQGNLAKYDNDGDLIDSGLNSLSFEQAGTVNSHESSYDHSLLHNKNKDTYLDYGGEHEVSAFGLKTHVNDAALHFPINDAIASASSVWSSEKIDYELDLRTSDLLAALAPPVDSLAELKALDTTSAATWPDKIVILVEDSGQYRLDRQSTLTEDSPKILQPTSGVGRWIRINSAFNSHNDMSGIQGGLALEKFHLSQDQYLGLLGLSEANPVAFSAELSAVAYSGRYTDLLLKPSHSGITDDEPAKHRVIDDNVTSTTSLWSSQKTSDTFGLKIPKVSNPIANNFPMLDTLGFLVNSQYSANSFEPSGSTATHLSAFDHSQLHIKNKDTSLDEGGSNQVTALEIKTHNADSAKHRTINDSSTATTSLWSASKINTALAGKSATTHNHTLLGLTEKSYNSLTEKPTIPTAHSQLSDDEPAKHRIINDSDSSATELWSSAKTQNELQGKASSTHNHTLASLSDKSGVLPDPQHPIPSEVVAAMGTKSNTNPLNHDRFTQGEITGLPESQLSLNYPTHNNSNDPTTNQKAALNANALLTGANPVVGLSQLHSNANDPTPNEKAAMTNANAPTALNFFATKNDLHSNANDPTTNQKAALDDKASLSAANPVASQQDLPTAQQLLTTNEKAALTNASNPNAANPLATISDLPVIPDLANLPTTNEKAALSNSQAPTSANPYVTLSALQASSSFGVEQTATQLLARTGDPIGRIVKVLSDTTISTVVWEASWYKYLGSGNTSGYTNSAWEYLPQTEAHTHLWSQINKTGSKLEDIADIPVPTNNATPKRLVSTSGVYTWEAAATPSVFGNNLVLLSDATLYQTTSSSYIATSTFSNLSLPSGTYYAHVTYYVRTSKNNKIVQVLTQVNGLDVTDPEFALIKDTWCAVSEQHIITSTGSPVSLSFFLRSASGSDTASSKNLKVSLWRIS